MTRYFRNPVALFILVLLAVSVASVAQVANQQHIIRLKNGSVYPLANARVWYDSVKQANVKKEPMQVLITFTALPTSEDKYLLEHSGIQLIEYLPDNTYLALINFSEQTELLLSLPVFSITNFKPDWKAGNYLWKKVKGKGAVEVLVSFNPGIDVSMIREFVGRMEGRLNGGHMERYGAYRIVIAADKVRALAQWYGVRYISPVSEIDPLDVQSLPAVRGNIAVAPLQHGGYGLTGDSVTVGVGDNTSGAYHIDLKDRVTNFNPAKAGHHGTHVNGIVGSAAIVDPLAASIAPHVSLVDFLYDLILPATGAMYNDHHMTITNNSYTLIAAECDYTGDYDIYSQFLDTLHVQYPEVLHVFASGNDGWMNCSPYLQGFATVGGGYQPAKNDVVVGSITDFLVQAADMSRGPVTDGRLKPEIVAIGLGSYSTINEDEYAWAAGTSMAAPQVAGGLAVLTQRYKQLNGGVQPRSEMIKAILLNGAMDLGNPGPDYTYGFGSMDMYRSLKIMDEGHYSANNIANGDSQMVTINVPAGMGHLKVMLCWADVPASAASSRQLVNDLDLSVIDPSTGVHLPLVLDPAPMNVNNNATEQPDRLNNTEQVTILNPPAGTYVLKIKGYNIPFGPQRYALTYDVMPKGIHLTFPIGGEQLANSMNTLDSTRVFWDAVSDGNMFTVQVSGNDGGSWTTVSDTVRPNARVCAFIASGFSTGKCRVRVLRNNTSEVVTSQKFVINTPPTLSLDTAQCPGYVNVHWSPVPNATRYYMLRKVGKYMQVVDSVTTDTVYSFSGMPLNEKSYVAVQPVIDGLPGYRSLAVIRKADSGNCTKPGSNGDLMVEKLVSRNGGRMFTSTAFSASSLVTVRLRNMYSSPAGAYTLSYKVNSGVWQTLVNPGIIPANGTADIDLVGVPIAPPGVYNIIVAVTNTGLTDPERVNDTLAFTITSLVNNPVSLTVPFTEGFETMPKFSVSNDSMGVSPDERWDYFNDDDFGRMRSFVRSDLTLSGTRSVSLDERLTVSTGSKNMFVGTFNLAGYDTVNAEIRMDFDYMLHGIPKVAAGNLVAVRAYDTLPWTTVHNYDLGSYPGILKHYKSVSVTDAIRLSGRNFSTACQVSFGQNDTSIIADDNYGNGLTLDNFRMYTVTNDVSLEEIVSPVPANCGMALPQPLVVKVHNGMNYTQYNIQMFYSLDGGTVMTGVIDSIKPKATVTYTFVQPVSMGEGITHSLNVWLAGAGDSYTANDSILQYRYRNNQVVAAYPYLENFENGNGGYYSEGFNNSWQYGTPASVKIKKAASGTKAWKTNLTGRYNNLEASYLYTPCFDIAGLSAPMLSFSTALDIENCGGALCDAAFVEISYDGSTWNKLGAAGQGTNWYDSTFNVWNSTGFTRWHVATILLPQPGPGVITHLRFVMSADPGVTFDGIAIDDIHVYDLEHAIHPADATITLTQDVSGTDRVDYLADNKLVAGIDGRGQNISGAAVTLYKQDTVHNPGSTQFTFPRSYTIKSTPAPADSVGVRLYLEDADIVAMENDTTCPSCGPVPDAYSLGITQYEHANARHTENGTLADDTGGVFTYHPYSKVKWVPYDKGYYAETGVKSFSEFWFNDGGPTANFPAGVDYLNFTAFRNGNTATLSWYSLIDTAVETYTPQWSIDSTLYGDVLDTQARHEPAAFYSIDDPVNFSTYNVFYFRLRWTMTGRDGVWYSPVRRVDVGDSANTTITFDAKMVDRRSVLLSWVSQIDGITDHYIVERARGGGSYTTVGNVPSLHRFANPYTLTDQPGDNIPTGTLLHYRLTAVLESGAQVVLPERTIEWINMGEVDVYPNPTHNGDVVLHWYADAGSRMQLVISDAMGKSFFSATDIATGWNNTTTVKTFAAPKGVYFVRVDIEGRRSFIKVVYQ